MKRNQMKLAAVFMTIFALAYGTAWGGDDIDFRNGTWSHPNGVSTDGWDETQSTGTTVLPDGTEVTVTVTAAGSAGPTNKNMTYFDESYFVGFALQQDPHEVQNSGTLENYMRVDFEFNEAVVVENFVMNDIDAHEVVQVEGWDDAPGAPGSGVAATYDPGALVEEYTFGGITGVTPKVSAPTYLTLDPGAFMGVSFDTYLKGFSLYYWWKGGVSVNVITIGFEGDLVVSKYRPRLYFTYEFTNDLSEPREVDFFDRLPEGLQWDNSYAPVFTNSMTGTVAFDEASREASIDGLMLPEGISTLKLRTKKTSETGTIENEARITPSVGDEVSANASITVTVP